MDLSKLNKMLANSYGQDKEKKRITVTSHVPLEPNLIDAVKSVCQLNGWVDIVVEVVEAPAKGLSIAYSWINPADAPKRLPGHIYA